MRKFRFRQNTAGLLQAARDLRQNQTDAEEVLWQALRERQLHGIKFRRQYPVERFIFDFYCPEARLVVELDGSVHDETMQRERDAARTAALEARNYRVIRFRNHEVLRDLPSVLERIAATVEDIRSQHTPSPAQFAGEGRGEGLARSAAP
jgi:very-short-patch-repair endonuclease